jgi:daunorubicin/doxorubicin transport system permease protein
MTTTLSPAADETVKAVTLDGIRDLPARPTARETWSQSLAMAWRATKKMRRNPEQWFDVTLQPLLFTAMFAYIFGGAISGSVADYLPILIPGILAQTALTASMSTGVQLREDMDKGVFDRFKSLPIARIAPLAGPAVADLVRYGTAATLTILTGLAMGYRPGGGVLGVLGGWAITVVAGWSLAWIFTYLGTKARSAQAVQGISMMIMFPLTFLSNAFVPESTLPDWLEAFVKVNPVSLVVDAVRDLMNDGQVTANVGWALVGCAVVVAVFLPLSVRSYSRKM